MCEESDFQGRINENVNSILIIVLGCCIISEQLRAACLEQLNLLENLYGTR
jgi:hypothetical protein